MKRILMISTFVGFIGSPMNAEDVLSHSWDTPPTSVTVEPSLKGDSIFDVVMHNRLSSCLGDCSSSKSVVLSYHDVEVTVNIEFGAGRMSEHVTIIPEYGYRAIPDMMEVEDETTVRFRIVQDLLG